MRDNWEEERIKENCLDPENLIEIVTKKIREIVESVTIRDNESTRVTIKQTNMTRYA